MIEMQTGGACPWASHLASGYLTMSSPFETKHPLQTAPTLQSTAR